MTAHPHTGKHAELFTAWLEPNGIIGWMPERARIAVDTNAGTVTWPKIRHEHGNDGPWGKDLLIKSDLDPSLRPKPGGGPVDDGWVVDEHTTPLVVPVTDRVRDLAKALDLELVEA